MKGLAIIVLTLAIIVTGCGRTKAPEPGDAARGTPTQSVTREVSTARATPEPTATAPADAPREAIFLGTRLGLAVVDMDSPVPPGPVTLVRDGNALFPAWSPDGSQIAYLSHGEYEGAESLHVVDSDGRGTHALVECDACILLRPAWSPDGLTIAFTGFGDCTAEHGSDGCWDVYTVRSDGTGLANLTNSYSADWGPVWSPDGDRIAFSSSRHDSGDDLTFAVYVMQADGTGVTRLTGVADDRWPIAWSSDGDSVLFATVLGDYTDIATVETGDLAVTPVARVEAVHGDWRASHPSPLWCQRTGMVATLAQYQPPWQTPRRAHTVSVVKPGEIPQVVLAPEVALAPVWAPDGRLTVLETDPGWSSTRVHLFDIVSGRRKIIWAFFDAIDDLMDWGADGPALLSWSPDGTELALATGQGITLVDASQAMLFLTPGPSMVPQWQPELGTVSYRIGRYDDYGQSSDGRRAYCVVQPDREEVTEIHAQLPPDAVWDAISPDRGQVAYATVTREGGGIRVAISVSGILGNDSRMVYEAAAPSDRWTHKTSDDGGATWTEESVGEPLYGLSPWSPDGSQLAFAMEAGSIMVVSSDGSGTPTRIPVPGELQLLAWSPDGTRIAASLVSEQHESWSWRLVVMNSDGSALMSLVEEPAMLRGVAWSPDGTHLAYVTYQDMCGENDGPRYDCSSLYTLAADGRGSKRLVRDGLPEVHGIAWGID